MSGLIERPWFLPTLSAALFVLAFYPFRIGALALVALAPLRLFAARPDATDKRTFWGAFAVGAVFALFLSYTTLVQFHWVYDAYLFTFLVRASTVPIVLVSGCLCGLALVLGRRTRSSSPLLQAALGAAIYTAVEAAISFCFKGYYFGTLAYALADWPVFRVISSYGGSMLATAAVAFTGFLLAEAVSLSPRRRGRFALQVAALAAALLAAATLLSRSAPSGEISRSGTLSVSLVQTLGRGENAFVTVRKDGSLGNSPIASVLRSAAAAKPDLIVYPFSPVEAAVRRSGDAVFDKEIVSAEEAAIGDWAASVTATSSLSLWYTTVSGASFGNEMVVWKGGEIEARYQKRHLYPFMDYTPRFAQAVGLFSTPVDGVAGELHQPFAPAGVPAGALICSEVNDRQLARQSAPGAGLLFSVGSEAMFIDDVAGAFNLASARFRAAENGVPVIRGSKFGPSAIIDARGEIVASLPFGASGVITAPVDYEVRESPRTVYGRFGDLVPLVALSLPGLIRIIEAFAVRRRGGVR